jgi:hypothetical protein
LLLILFLILILLMRSRLGWVQDPRSKGKIKIRKRSKIKMRIRTSIFRSESRLPDSERSATLLPLAVGGRMGSPDFRARPLTLPVAETSSLAQDEVGRRVSSSRSRSSSFTVDFTGIWARLHVG